MTDEAWHHSSDPLVVCSRGSVVELAAVLPASGRFVVVRLDGTGMADSDHVFYDFSNALLFPSYFGWNWDALSDCFRDLHWLPADGYLVIVDNASHLMPDSARDRHVFFRILAEAVRHWVSPLGRPQGKVTPFKVLLLCDRDEDAVLLRQDIAQALHNGH